MIGISEYQRGGPHYWPRLHTDKDVDEIRQVLLDKFGFEEQGIITLRDQQATRAAITAMFRDHLIKKATPGSVVVIYWAGHGQRLPDDNGDEADGMDESLVPYDAPDQRARAGARTNLRDDELGDLLEELAQRMRVSGHLAGNITVILDSCFSGTATRGVSVGRGRGWDPSLDGPQPAPRSLPQRDSGSGLLPEGRAAAPEYVLLAAAQDNQIAQERGNRGVFTRALVRALRDSRSDAQTTYRALLDRVAVEVMTEVHDQVPQAEGAIDQLLFSGLAKPRSPSQAAVRAIVHPNGTVDLPLGTLHDTTVGSVFSLHPLDAMTLDASTRIGTATIIAVTPFGSRARLLGPCSTPVPGPLGVLALEIAHRYDDLPLRLQLPEPSRIPEVVLQVLHALDVVKVLATDTEEYDVQVRYNQKTQRLQLRRAGHRSVFAGLPVNSTIKAELARLLAGLWRARFLARLRNNNPKASVEVRFVPTEAKPNSLPGHECTTTPKADPPPSSHLLLHPGDCVQLELINRSGRSVYFAVIEIDDRGQIEPQIPCPGCGEDNLLHTSTEPFRYRYPFRITGQAGERSLWKVIVTSDYVPFQTLSFNRSTQRAVRKPAAPRFQPLLLLLRNAAAGKRTMVGTAGAMSQEDWGTAEALTEVSPPGH